MEAGIILLCLGLLLLTGSAVAAFSWAARNGQFDNLDTASTVIFDADEPEGEPGDCFPDERSRTAMAVEKRLPARAA